MRKLEIPPPFRQLLEAHELDDVLRPLVSESSKILGHNKLYFFPDYTDHGIEHVEQVLLDQWNLIPSSTRDLLTPGDAFLIVASTILHDLAMHMSPASVQALIQSDNHDKKSVGLRFKPHGEMFLHDYPWRDLWASFVAESRGWGEDMQERIFGPSNIDKYLSLIHI